MPTERGTHPMWPIAPKNGAPETPQSQCRRPPHRPPTARPPSIPEIMLIAHTSRGTPIPCPYTNITPLVMLAPSATFEYTIVPLS